MSHITCFITSLSSGGAEHQLSELAYFLTEKKFDVSFVTFTDVNDHYKLDSKIQRIRIGRNRGKIGKFISIFKFFLSWNTDCVISFGQRENLLMLLPMLFRPKIKVIAGERNLTYGKASKIEKILFNILYKRANWIVPNSHSQEEHILKVKPQYANKVVTITNYTDTYKYNPQASVENEILNIGIFCRYNKQKNYERFAHAVKLVKDQTALPFVINWYGNQTFKDKSSNPDYLKFKELVIQLGIEDVLILNDHVTNVPEVMKNLDAFCLPSLFEGFSNSLSEAICCGKPILASNVSDNSTMVCDGENGFLFNPMQEEYIANAIIKLLLLNKEEKETFGKKSREIALSLFDKKLFVEKYIKLIES